MGNTINVNYMTRMYSNFLRNYEAVYSDLALTKSRTVTAANAAYEAAGILK